MDAATGSNTISLPLTTAVEIAFSPKGTFLSTWERPSELCCCCISTLSFKAKTMCSQTGRRQSAQELADMEHYIRRRSRCLFIQAATELELAIHRRRSLRLANGLFRDPSLFNGQFQPRHPYQAQSRRLYFIFLITRQESLRCSLCSGKKGRTCFSQDLFPFFLFFIRQCQPSFFAKDFFQSRQDSIQVEPIGHHGPLCHSIRRRQDEPELLRRNQHVHA